MEAKPDENSETYNTDVSIHQKNTHLQNQGSSLTINEVTFQQTFDERLNMTQNIAELMVRIISVFIVFNVFHIYCITSWKHQGM